MYEVTIAKFDVNDDEVTIVEIYVSEGAYVKQGDALFKAESMKMVKDVQAEREGYVHLCCEVFGRKRVGERVFILYETREEYEANYKKDSVVKAEDAQENVQMNATQKALDLAKELKVDINKIAREKGDALIKTKDVEAYANTLRIQSEMAPVRNYTDFVPMTINTYDRERVVIIGAGRLSEQVIDILLDDKDKQIIGLVDTYKKEYPSYPYPLLPCDVYNFPDIIDRHQYDTAIIALGCDKKAMLFRKELFELYKGKDIQFTNAIGDNVSIRRAVSIGENNIIMHNCFVGTGTHIGDDNIISYGTCLGHHSIIGSHNLFAPGCITAGGVKIGSDGIFMTGMNLMNYVSVGDNVVLPVGYNVMQNISDNTNLLKMPD